MPASTTSTIATSAFFIFPSAPALLCSVTSLFLYFRLLALSKSGGRNFLPPFHEQPGLGCREVRVVHFVGFATMALTAELRHRVAGRADWVVVAADEEHGLEHALDAADRALVGRHAVLVVAGGAAHRGVDAVKGHGAHGEAIVLCHEDVHLRPGGIGDLAARNRAIPVVVSAAANRGQRSNWVIVFVVAWSTARLVAEPCRSVSPDSIRDRFDGLARHHSVLGQIAVMAAEAEHDADRRIMYAGSHIRWGCDWETACIAKRKRLAVVRHNIRTPQRRITAGRVRCCDAVAPCAAVRCVAGYTTPAINEVRAQHVRRRRPIRVHLRGSKRRHRQDSYENQHDSFHK